MEDMTKTTVTMTEKSVEEARAVRIIAIVTLLYLPPTFTAVSRMTSAVLILKLS